MANLDLTPLTPLIVGAYIAVIPIVITISLAEWTGAMMFNAIFNRRSRSVD